MSSRNRRKLSLRILQFAAQNSPLSSLISLARNNYSHSGDMLNMRDEKGWTALHHASHHGNVTNIKLLLDNNADPMIKNNKGETPMHLAAKKSRTDLLVLFVGKVDWNATDRQGQTALHVVCNLKHTRSRNIEVLLEDGAVALQDKKGQTPCHLVAAKPAGDLLRLFVRRGVNLNLQDKHGYTALHFATSCKNFRHVKLLLKSRARVDLKNDDGHTPFHLAARMGEVAILRALCRAVPTSRKEILDIKDSRGWTALHFAAFSKSVQVVYCLLENSAFVDSRNNFGETPLHFIALLTLYDFVEVFMIFGASVDVKNNLGYTVFRMLKDQFLIQYDVNNTNVQPSLEEALLSLVKQYVYMSVLQIPVDKEMDAYVESEWSKQTLQLQSEIQKIKSTQVHDGFFLYDLVTQGDYPRFLMDVDLVNKLEEMLFSPTFPDKFRHFGYILRMRYRRAKQSRFYLTLLALEFKCGDELYQANADIWRNIFSFLTENELINFIKSAGLMR